MKFEAGALVPAAPRPVALAGLVWHDTLQVGRFDRPFDLIVDMSERMEEHLASAKKGQRIAVVIPSYEVERHILDVLSRIGPEISQIYVVDDCCPNGSGRLVEDTCRDPRVTVIYQKSNTGVGGAVISGYQRAFEDDMEIVVKVDGDGQMAPELIPALVAPIVTGEADYTKGNRFFNPEDVRKMPIVRLIGNAGLSFLTKLSSGYWSIFDPTNGFTAIHTSALQAIPLDKLARRYFFESDILFRLNLIRCRVVDVPMLAVYEDEKSNLSVKKVILEFLGKNLKNTLKRIFYNYFLRNFSVASLSLVLGLVSLGFGVTFGAIMWASLAAQGESASSGTVMLAGLPTLVGIQLLLSFLAYDFASEPHIALHPRLLRRQAIRRLMAEPQEPVDPAAGSPE